MNICSNGHSEIVYTGWTCPLCDLHTDLVQLRHDYEQLEGQFDIAEAALADLTSQCATYRSILADIAPKHLL